MALTDAQICSVGLLRIGERQVIDDLNASSAPARNCKSLYPLALAALLEEFKWKFATRRATLAQLAIAGVSVTRDGWGSVYSLPGDCAVVHYIYPGTTNPSSDARIPFERELADDAGGLPSIPVLLTNLSPASLVYTSNKVPTALFPGLFADALAWRMAYELALALAVKPAVGEKMLREYGVAWKKAAASDLRQSQQAPPPDSSFVRGR